MTDGSIDVEAVLARLARQARKPAAPCAKCGRRERARGFRYCEWCGRSLLTVLERAGYLESMGRFVPPEDRG